MKFTVDKNEKTKEVNFGTLKFDSGKKIMLDAGEVKEYMYLLNSKHAEGKICGDGLITLTRPKEFFVTGAYIMGVEHAGKKLLVVTQIEEDTFYDGEECNERVEKEYGL